MWDYRARITHVHDGDTITVQLDLGLSVAVTVVVRLDGAWAPELQDIGGMQTRDHLRAVIASHEASRAADWPWRVTTRRVRSDEHEVMTLGRYVATVRPLVVGRESSTLTEAVNGFVTGNGYPRGTGG